MDVFFTDSLFGTALTEQFAESDDIHAPPVLVRCITELERRLQETGICYQSQMSAVGLIISSHDEHCKLIPRHVLVQHGLCLCELGHLVNPRDYVLDGCMYGRHLANILNDPCSFNDTGCCYHYCSNSFLYCYR